MAGKKHKWLIWTGIAIAVAGIAFVINDQIQKLKDITFSVKKFRLLKISNKLIRFKLGLNVLNKSNIDIDVNSYVMDVYLNGKMVSTVTSNNQLTYKAKSENYIEATVAFDPSKVFVLKDLLELLKQFALDKSQVKLQIKGYFTGGVGPVSVKKYPFDVLFDATDFEEEETIK